MHAYYASVIQNASELIFRLKPLLALEKTQAVRRSGLHLPALLMHQTMALTDELVVQAAKLIWIVAQSWSEARYLHEKNSIHHQKDAYCMLLFVIIIFLKLIRAEKLV